MRVTRATALRVGNKLGLDWKKYDVREFQKGLDEELEHKDLTKGNLVLTGKIVIAHLREKLDYYTRLSKAMK